MHDFLDGLFYLLPRPPAPLLPFSSQSNRIRFVIQRLSSCALDLPAGIDHALSSVVRPAHSGLEREHTLPEIARGPAEASGITCGEVIQHLSGHINASTCVGQLIAVLPLGITSIHPRSGTVVSRHTHIHSHGINLLVCASCQGHCHSCCQE